MKVVVIVLAIVAAVVAQREMRGEAIMRLPNDRSITGFFTFNQPSPSANITIVGSVIGLPPRIYSVIVQDGGINSINCSSLDPVREIYHNAPFRLFYLIATNERSHHTRWSCSTATLEPNRTNSICDTTIAIYRTRNLCTSNGIPNFRPKAYGHLFCDRLELPNIHRAAIP